MREAASLVVASLRPRDPVEAMLAARLVSAHFHVMDNFRAAAQPDLLPNLQLRYQGRAIALCRMMDTTLRDLRDRQGAAARRPAVGAAVGAPVTQPAVEVVKARAVGGGARAGCGASARSRPGAHGAARGGGAARTPRPRARRAARRAREGGCPGRGRGGRCHAAAAAGRGCGPRGGLHDRPRGLRGGLTHAP